MTTDINALLVEREKTHGDYVLHALITQDLKRVIRHYVADLDVKLDDDMQETLDMIAHKIGRIIAGNPAEPDHWRDIAGYAQLVANRLERTDD
jgi:predicted enzyme related to lactoylglutathione lyase